LRTFAEYAWPVVEPGTPFLPNWHVDLVCDYLQAVTAGQIQRLVINLPPRYGKSYFTSVCWPVWEWIQRPNGRWIFLSHHESLASKLALDRRRLMQSDRFRQRWGHLVRLMRDQASKTDVHNTRGGVMFATSMGGSVTGKGANRLVVDDPHSPDQAESDTQRRQTIERFLQSHITRLDDKGRDAIVIVMQRLHVEDLAGVCLDLGFEHLCVPALAPRHETIVFPLSGRTHVRRADDPVWPAREDRDQLERLRGLLGSYGFAGQYQQDPVPRTGGLFAREWWGWYDEAPAFTAFDQILQSWDLAFKEGDGSDFVVGLVVGRIGERIFVLDRYKQKASFTETCRAIEACSATYPATSVVLVEDTANGPAVVNTLQTKIRGLIAVRPEGGKQSRAMAVQPWIEAGQISLPRLQLTTGEYRADRRWVDDFVETCAHFPRGAHDDDVDALTQVLVWCQTHPTVHPCGVCRLPDPVLTPRFQIVPRPSLVTGEFAPHRLSRYVFGQR
jgi:predicted phage terminase large subunit-like protein